MVSRMNEFREFVSLHPLLRDEVKKGSKTWQSIYEEWVLYGDSNELWGTFAKEDINQKKENNANKNVNKNTFNMDNMKNVLGYVKNINPDKVNRTLNNVQKVIQIVQTVSGPKSVNIPESSSVFSDWWDQ